MVGELYLPEAEYEAMSVEELTERFTDLQLREILKHAFGLGSVVYFIGKAEKLRYITQPDQRPDVLAGGDAKQEVHREANRENRKKPSSSVEERMLEETKDRVYRQVGITRAPGTADAFTGRIIRDVYVIEDVVDGTRFLVSRGTARKLDEWGRLEGFVVTKGRLSAAHAAGVKSLADYFAAPQQESKSEAKVAGSKKAKVEAAPKSAAIGDQDLEDLLNSLPS